MTPTDQILPSSRRPGSNAEGEDVDAGPEEPVKVLEKQGTFDEITVWGHEILPAADDAYVKGVEEWVRFAETVCVMFRCCFISMNNKVDFCDADARHTTISSR